MEYIIADKRLENLLQRDKSFDMMRVCEVLKGEIAPTISQYLNLSKPINVRFKKEGDKLLFLIEVEAIRVKPFGYLP